MISRTLLKRSLPTVQFLRPFTRSSIRRSAHEEDLVNLNELPRQKSLEENYVPLINPTEKYKFKLKNYINLVLILWHVYLNMFNNFLFGKMN